MSTAETSPYHLLPSTSLWREAVSGLPLEVLNPHLNSPFRIEADDRVASAGSCFAQRISGALQAAGLPYLVTEAGPAFLSPEVRKSFGYGIYSARYGNVYSALQLVQLFDRAFGEWAPEESFWRNRNGRFVDPFRPAVQRDGFASADECQRDRESHLAAVREMFLQLDVFIFTLGLTETWRSVADGAVFPVCPGAGLGGDFDSGRYRFHNFGVAEVVAQLDEFLVRLRRVNPAARTILTVSPVPLAATFEPRHVMQSTVYSKSVLRVACEEIVRRHPQVAYFAAYEIVTAGGGSHSGFEADRRTVTVAAVDHVIRCFREQFLPGRVLVPAGDVAAAGIDATPMCDEELLFAALAAPREPVRR